MASVEVIITSYKNPVYLRECLLSLISQSFQDFEVTIVDDNSPDDPISVIQDLLDANRKIHYSRNVTNCGGPSSFFNVSTRGKSKYLMWLHHDDFLHPTFLEKSVEALEKNQHCGFSYSLCSRVINGVPREEFPGSIRPNLETGAHDISFDSVINCWIMWSCALIRRETFNLIGGIAALHSRYIGRNLDPNYSSCSDLYIFARLSCFSPTYVLNERLCFYRDHPDATTNDADLNFNHIMGNVRTYDCIFDDVSFFSEEVRVVAKINSIGRLCLGDVGLAATAAQLLYIGQLGKEFRHIRREVVQKLAVVMRRYIMDRLGLQDVCHFSAKDIYLMDRLASISDSFSRQEIQRLITECQN